MMIIKADIIENAAADHTMLSRSCAHSSDCSKATSAKTFALARCALAVSTVLCGMLATPLLAQAQNLDLATPGMVESGDINPFHFDSNIIDTIQFSRVETTDQTLRYAERQTEFSLSLKPAMPKFSLENGFGLNMFSHAQPAVEIESGRLGRNRLVESIPDLHNGFAYSAGVKVEHEDEDIDGTAYVSSGLLGLSYGRLGRLWYGGVDLNVEQFVHEGDGTEPRDVLSVDFTTGRRMGWSGTSSVSPLWMLSLQGNLDLQEKGLDQEERGDWYLNPSLFWQNPDFTFSAQVQVPVEAPSSEGTVEPDYRLRAVFEKQF